ncbi:MAG: DUF1816 domain-containing protein [Leptolyngbyaceae cyanobacterium]
MFNTTGIVMLPFFSSSAQKPWWVKVHTKTPQCVYFFGPFDSAREAKIHQHGYIEDLVDEGARGVRAVTHRGNPQMLTIVKE